MAMSSMKLTTVGAVMTYLDVTPDYQRGIGRFMTIYNKLKTSGSQIISKLCGAVTRTKNTKIGGTK
jgi:hypothetical protein